LIIKAAKVPEVLDYGNVTALYKVCEVLDLQQIINRHVFKGGAWMLAFRQYLWQG